MKIQSASQVEDFEAAQALRAMSDIVALEAEIEGGYVKVRAKLVERWKDYGAILLRKRKQLPSKKEFGRWVKENGLDKPPCSSHVVRSSAMWLAENYSNVNSVYNKINRRHPNHIRQECRKLGYDWALAEKKEGRYSWMAVVESEGIPLKNSGAIRQARKAEFKKINSDPKLFTKAKEQELRKVCVIWHSQHDAQKTREFIEEAKESIEKESHKVRLEKAIAKVRLALEGEYNKRIELLEKGFDKRLDEAVAIRVEKAQEDFRELTQEYRDRIRDVQFKEKGIKQIINRKQLQLILNCLHPDRAPGDRVKKFSNAFDIVKKLQPYVDSFEG